MSSAPNASSLAISSSERFLLATTTSQQTRSGSRISAKFMVHGFLMRRRVRSNAVPGGVADDDNIAA